MFRQDVRDTCEATESGGGPCAAIAPLLQGVKEGMLINVGDSERILAHSPVVDSAQKWTTKERGVSTETSGEARGCVKSGARGLTSSELSLIETEWPAMWRRDYVGYVLTCFIRVC